MELNIKIDPNTDLDKVLEKIKNFEKRVRIHKKFKRKLDLGTIRLKGSKPIKKSKHVLIPMVREDGTVDFFRTRREAVSFSKLNRTRLQLYTKALVENTFRHPTWSWRKIKIETNKQFKEEFDMDEFEMDTLTRKSIDMEEQLKQIGLGREDIAAMIKEDLVERKGNRDRLLQIVIDMWNRIDDAKVSTETEETRKVIDMMKKVIDGKDNKKVEAPKMIESGTIEEQQEEISTIPEYKESLNMEELINNTK